MAVKDFVCISCGCSLIIEGMISVESGGNLVDIEISRLKEEKEIYVLACKENHKTMARISIAGDDIEGFEISFTPLVEVACGR